MQVNILVGEAALLNDSIYSAINKEPILTPQYCGWTGLIEDTQVSTAFHGGTERALHYYPKEHYAFWRAWYQAMALTNRAPALEAGAFGENISGTGLLEQEACIGDIYRLDNALVQISQPRSPCYKLNARFGYEAFSLIVQTNGRTGWLLRVLETGEVGPQAHLRLTERPHPQMSVKRASDIVYNQAYSSENLQELARLTALSESWQQKAKHYLEAGQVADWRMRLWGQAGSDSSNKG